MNYTTPPDFTPALLKAIGQMSPNFQPAFFNVTIEKHVKEKNACYPNVLVKTRADGGKMVTGWKIFTINDDIAQFVAHAIWKSDAGDLRDISEDDTSSTRILFVECENPPFPFQAEPPENGKHFLKVPPPAFKMLNQGELARDLFAQERPKMGKPHKRFELDLPPE